jgi:siroheme synthase
VTAIAQDRSGRLFGVGLGPGSPDYVTLRALRVLDWWDADPPPAS